MLRQKLTLIFGLALFIALYFWGHNVPQTPFFTDLRPALGQVLLLLWDVLAVGFVVAVGGGIGRLILRDRLLGISRTEKTVFFAGTGLGVISLVALLLGFIGQYNGLAFLIALGIAWFFTFRQTGAWLTDLRQMSTSIFVPLNLWQVFVLVWVTTALTLSFIMAAAPAFAWDALVYHLVAPARYLAEGAIRTQADNYYLGFPQLVEVLYGITLSLGHSTGAPALLHWGMGVLGITAISGFVERYADKNAANVSVLLVLGSTSFWLLFGWAYVDLGVMLYGTLAVIALLEWRQQGAEHWLVIAAVMAGFALGTKYTAGLLIIAMSILILVRAPKQIIRNGAIFAGVLLGVFALWLVKGFWLYGNPVYPYVFGGVGWDSLKAANSSGAGAGLLNGDIFWQLQIPFLPFTATLFGQEKVSPYAATLSPLLLSLPFALVLGWKQLEGNVKTVAQDVTLLGIIVLVLWMGLAAVSGIGAQPRLMLVALCLPVILGSLTYHSATKWQKKPLDIRFVLQATIVLVSLVPMIDFIEHFAETRAIEYHTGNLSAENYLARQDSYLAAVEALDGLPEGSTVLFMWEPKSLYCPDTLTCIPDVLYDNWSYPLRADSLSADDLMQQYQDDGVDYLMIFGLDASLDVGYQFWLDVHGFAREENEQFITALDSYLEKVTDLSTGYSLYTWR